MTPASMGGQIVWPSTMTAGSWVSEYCVRVGHWLWNERPTVPSPRGEAVKWAELPELKKNVGSTKTGRARSTVGLQSSRVGFGLWDRTDLALPLGPRDVGYARVSSSTGMVRTPAVWRAYSAKPG